MKDNTILLLIVAGLIGLVLLNQQQQQWGGGAQAPPALQGLDWERVKAFDWAYIGDLVLRYGPQIINAIQKWLKDNGYSDVADFIEKQKPV